MRAPRLPLVGAALVCLLPAVAAEQEPPVRVAAGVAEGEITIGDPIAYTVTVRHPPDVRVRLPAADAGLAPFEVRDYRVEQQPGETRAIYEVAVYDVAEQTIPAVEVQYVGPNGEQGTVTTEPVTINVESVLPPDAEDILDIRGPKSVKGSPVGTILAVLLALALLAALLVGVKLWRRRERPAREKIAPPPPPPRPPEDVAYEELDALARSDLLARGMVKAYYTELGDILRRYIEGLYAVPALESTTQEIVDELPDAGVGEDVTDRFRHLLGECDLVKFARHRPPDERCDDALQGARGIIGDTKPRR
ncbi:MAG: hypothetical protein PVH68_17490, partial [Armatimonadota bacterium]